MTFCTLAGRDGGTLGLRTERGILDVARACRLFRINAPTDIHSVIEGADCAPLRKLAEKALNDRRGKRVLVPESRARFGPAVPRPGKIICVGLNYRRHAQETGNPIPPVPILFNKYNNALVGHRGRIRLPTKVSSQFDYEVELVVVMGRTARDVPEEKALSHVFGYATGNDFSARDLMRATSQLMLGKACDGFAPLGPYVVSADQIPDPQNLKLATTVNGEERQNSNTSDMIYSCAQIVSYCSRHLTLSPGDIIYTGTPQGVILGYPPGKQVWLKAGDRVVTEVEKCGALEVTLV
ncbi:MAG: 5-carboxymethyl-2-hydroxymuconate isomerase [Betaproteobacteria bacterium RIFCSPLOWO2_02_FULL_67_26]|nr:MAG: 5-carboxymethyl-2-hydroxymuconate isomerase [Betaproteobacteria bacterium RIFCSPLOWO2_02_FULL_67_26]